MSKVVVFNHLTLDGVMQAPGRADEDRRGGFKHGGWATARMDAVLGSAAAEGFAALRLVDSKTSTTGVVIATYEPAITK
jgi:acyl-coenzyme A thioesterase PaaI-like protein